MPLKNTFICIQKTSQIIITVNKNFIKYKEYTNVGEEELLSAFKV